MTHENGSLRELYPRALAPIHRPPPVLLYDQGNIQFHVERLLQNLRHHGQNQYRYSGMGIQRRITRRQNCPYAVDIF